MMCVDICGANAISIVRRGDGFRYPHVDRRKCVGCGLCVSRCPLRAPNSMSNQLVSHAYVAWSQDREIRRQSSSGGVFSILARRVIAENGLVAGAVVDGLEVRHILTDDLRGLAGMRGSKYLQSKTEGIFRAVKEKLLEGRTVLFSGTPCQCMGVISFCGPGLRTNLIVADLICHGVPSDRIIPLTEYGCGESISAILACRSKEHGSENTYVYRFLNREGKEKALIGDQNCSLQLYVSSLLCRDSCYRCPFARTHRETDFTLADFHEKPDITPAEKEGISLVLTHNHRAEQFLHRLSDLELTAYPVADALSRKSNSFTSNKLVYHHFARRLLRLFTAVLPLSMQYFLYNQRQRRKHWFTLPLRVYEKILFTLEEQRLRLIRSKLFPANDEK